MEITGLTRVGSNGIISGIRNEIIILIGHETIARSLNLVIVGAPSFKVDNVPFF